jgi:hypothetical protein
MTNHNTPQLSGMGWTNQCAAFPGLSALSATTIILCRRFRRTSLQGTVQWVLQFMFPSACSEAESFKHMKINIWRILHTWRWPCRPKHVVKDSENQNTIKLHANGNITCNTHWTIQCSRMLKYSIIQETVITPKGNSHVHHCSNSKGHHSTYVSLEVILHKDKKLQRQIVFLVPRKCYISACNGLENRDYGDRGSAALTTRHPSSRKS